MKWHTIKKISGNSNRHRSRTLFMWIFAQVANTINFKMKVKEL